MSDQATLSADVLQQLQQWQGRTETLHDLITAVPVSGLSATLDRQDPEPKAGTPLPPLWHWLFFFAPAAT